MSVFDFLQNTACELREKGVRSTARTVGVEVFRNGPLRRLDKLGYKRGPNIYDFDWDLLLVLDACRADLMREVYPEYDFPEEYAEIHSVGSKSQQWLERTFATEYQDEVSRTTYVTANMFSSELDPARFNLLDELWQTHWDEDIGIVPPRPVTDRAITELRENNPDRLIVHYMQPHYPFIDNKLADGVNLDYAFRKEGDEQNVWSLLEAGEVGREEVWTAYRENLRLVMNEVELLLSNADVGSVVVTSDHGNAFGSLGIYGHPPLAVSCLREVPFIRTSGTDTRTYDPEVTEPSIRHGDQMNVDSRLAALGYK
ncbi:hypothetical protein [Halobaculum magnesiiphilum]|uniref:Sulfatase n=1 Tax=Halobaculum magnesiiphilum TaxID=1017351 RepID=A0A8T8WEF3_9EURY|nr:hypothetical protein [Halobaculum magnesiiphilum]QZP38239.1 hypothetical protein K6T50_03530 [Halobaculum magnesiiphilum]